MMFLLSSFRLSSLVHKFVCSWLLCVRWVSWFLGLTFRTHSICGMILRVFANFAGVLSLGRWTVTLVYHVSSIHVLRDLLTQLVTCSVFRNFIRLVVEQRQRPISPLSFFQVVLFFPFSVHQIAYRYVIQIYWVSF